MAVIDASAFTGARLRRINLNPLAGAIALAAALLVMGTILALGFSDNGFRLASQLAWRFAGLVLFAALAAGPVCRLGGHLMPDLPWPDGVGRRLAWAFCASYGIYLLAIFLPNLLALSAGAGLVTLFGGGAALVMALTAVPLKRLGGGPLIGDKTRRVLLGTAAAYFWGCYTLMALSRLSGPHRPDAWYAVSFWLMLLALLLRYADSWLTRRLAAC